MKREPTKLLTIEANNLILDMNMDNRDFAQARLIPFIEESGWRAIPEITEEGIETFKFEAWNFSETSEKEGYIQIEGKTTCNTTLLSILESVPKNPEIINSVKNVCKAIQQGISNKIEIPQVGPEGTLLAEDGSILFLPETLFNRAAECRPQVEYSKLLGCWINPALSREEGLYFTESVYIYYALTEKLPYPLPYTDRRCEDYFDKNFIPIELIVPNINSTLAQIININLSRQGAIRIAKKNTASVRVQRNSIPSQPIPLEDIKEIESIKIEDEELRKKRENYEKQLNKTIKRARFIRKNNSLLKILAASFITLIIIILMTINGNQDKYTPKGLTSIELCEALYTGIQNMDITLLQEICHGRKMNSLIDSVSTFYVTTKVRESVERNGGTFTPAQWLYLDNTRYWLYGITNVQIDGKEASSDLYPEIRKAKPKPITEESGIQLKPGDIKTFTGNCYFVYSDGVENISIEKCTDIITIEYIENSWYVVDFSREYEESSILLKDFNTDYKAELENNNGAVMKSIADLKNKYEWLPTPAEMVVGATKLNSKLDLKQAQDDLNALKN